MEHKTKRTTTQIRHVRLAKKAVKSAGGQTELAKAMAKFEPTVRQGHVSHWISFRRLVSPRMSVAMEKAVEGVVTRDQFHPDLFGKRGEAV